MSEPKYTCYKVIWTSGTHRIVECQQFYADEGVFFFEDDKDNLICAIPIAHVSQVLVHRVEYGKEAE